MVDRLGFPEGLDFSLKGATAAVERYRSEMGRRDAMAFAISESLWWIASVDKAAQQQKGYFDRREQSPEGRTVGGLIYVRNLHNHQLRAAAAIDVSVGPVKVITGNRSPAQVPGATPTGFYRESYRWSSLTDLPDPQIDERHRRDEWYEERVAGRPISHPLEEAIEWLRPAEA